MKLTSIWHMYNVHVYTCALTLCMYGVYMWVYMLEWRFVYIHCTDSSAASDSTSDQVLHGHALPAGVVQAAAGHEEVLIWCENQPRQGEDPWHTATVTLFLCGGGLFGGDAPPTSGLTLVHLVQCFWSADRTCFHVHIPVHVLCTCVITVQSMGRGFSMHSTLAICTCLYMKVTSTCTCSLESWDDALCG